MVTFTFGFMISLLKRSIFEPVTICETSSSLSIINLESLKAICLAENYVSLSWEPFWIESSVNLILQISILTREQPLLFYPFSTLAVMRCYSDSNLEYPECSELIKLTKCARTSTVITTKNVRVYLCATEL